MSLTNMLRKVARSVVIATTVLGGSAAFALPISGSFELVGDPLGSFPDQLVASGSFVSSGVIGPETYQDNDGNTYSTIELDFFEINSALFGTFVGTDFVTSLPDGIQAPVLAVLEGSDPFTVLGFTGSGGNVALAQNADGNSVILTGPNFAGAPLGSGFPAQPGQGATFDGQATNGTIVTAAVSGVQVVPEPSALALLGIGLVAFGSVRRKFSKA